MSFENEVAAVRRAVRELARRADHGLLRRYALWHPVGQRRTPYRRFRKALGRFLRAIRVRPTQPAEPWRPTLNHAPGSAKARAFVIWAVGADRATLRRQCTAFAARLAATPGWIPVLITDVADFRFFSRLGWLVEFVPEIGPNAAAYRERKLAHLAWLYRDLPVVPGSAGLPDAPALEELLR